MPPTSPLIAAIARQDPRACATLLRAGADPESAGADGRTPLALAVASADAHLAALLLAHGARWDGPARDGRLPLDASVIGLPLFHRIRQEYQRLPLAPWAEREPPAELAPLVRTLDADGIVRVRGLVDPPMLARLRAEFPRFIRRLRLHYRLRRLVGRPVRYHYDLELHWLFRERVYTSNNAFRDAPTLLTLARDPRLVAVARHYLRKPAYLQRAQAMRYLESEAVTTNQFGWHHDMEDRRLKAMILLTDVEDDGQSMRYVLGSHVAYHPYERFFENTLDFDYCRTYVPTPTVFRTVGRAGDVFLFDSNGMHRGDRAPRTTRDVFFLEYSADKALNWGSTIPRRLLARIPDAPENPLHRLRHATPKWRLHTRNGARTETDWVVTLPHPATWV